MYIEWFQDKPMGACTALYGGIVIPIPNVRTVVMPPLSLQCVYSIHDTPL